MRSFGKALSLRTLIAGYFIGSAIYFFYGSITDIIEKHHGDVLDFLDMHGWKFNVPKIAFLLLLAIMSRRPFRSTWTRILAACANIGGLVYFGYWLRMFVPYNCFNLLPNPDQNWYDASHILVMHLPAYLFCAWDLASEARRKTEDAAWRCWRTWAAFLVLIAILIGVVAQRVHDERLRMPSYYEDMGQENNDADIIRGAFTIREVTDTFVRRLDIPGIDTSWSVALSGRMTSGKAFILASRNDSSGFRYLYGRYDLVGGIRESISWTIPVGSRISQPSSSGYRLTRAQFENASETSGFLTVFGNSGDSLISLPVPGAWQILGWADPHAILISLSDWKRETFAYRLPNGSETITLGIPKPTSYRMIRFREDSDTKWSLDRYDDIPLFPNHEGVQARGMPAPSRRAVILPGDSSNVVLRASGRSTSGPYEEWLYDIDLHRTEPRGVFIDGSEQDWYAPRSAAYYGRVRLYSNEPRPQRRSRRINPDSIPYLPGSNRQEVDTQALFTMLEKEIGSEVTSSLTFTPPRERLEWVSDGKTYVVDEFSDSWSVSSIFRSMAGEIWILSGRVACDPDSNVCRPPSRLRLSFLDDASKTCFNFIGSEYWRFPWIQAFDHESKTIYFAAWEPSGWTVRCITFH